MSLRKPKNIKDDKFLSAKWDELTCGKEFKDGDAPLVGLLCTWYQVLDRCQKDLTADGAMQVAYSNKIDDIKALPQIGIMKQASAEIRQLNKQLGIKDTHEDKPQATITPLTVLQGKYKAGGKVVNE